MPQRVGKGDLKRIKDKAGHNDIAQQPSQAITDTLIKDFLLRQHVAQSHQQKQHNDLINDYMNWHSA